MQTHVLSPSITSELKSKFQIMSKQWSKLSFTLPLFCNQNFTHIPSRDVFKNSCPENYGKISMKISLKIPLLETNIEAATKGFQKRKKNFLKISKYWQENICVGVYF